jgi:spoIIIJ-associated protein
VIEEKRSAADEGGRSEQEVSGDEVSRSGEVGAEGMIAQAAITQPDGGEAEQRSASDLDDEGDVAADYIEELLDIADLDGDIDIETRGERVYLSVTSADAGDLRLLAKPDTVTALQELTRIAVQTKTGSYSRLILDIGGSRAARRAELAVLVDRAIERLQAGAAAASLPPMSSYERKLVHDMVAERGFVSQSEDEGRNRHTVITEA